MWCEHVTISKKSNDDAGLGGLRGASCVGSLWFIARQLTAPSFGSDLVGGIRERDRETDEDRGRDRFRFGL